MLTVRNAIIAAAVMVALVLTAFGLWQLNRSRAAQSRVDAAQNSAVVESAKDAIGTQEAAAGREQASEEMTTQNSKEIRSAEGADAKVSTGVNDAGIRSLCRRPAYRNSERCRVFAASPE